MSTGKRRGGLRKRITDDTFVQVPSKTVNDARVSYRALGILSWLLEKPDGWDVRAQQIAGQSEEREGVGAVRSALNELAIAGYYRLERIQYRDGKFEMSTAVSKTPVDRWAEQARIFDGKGGVPLIAVEDGTYLVKYPDGTLLPDDFPPPTAPDDTDSDQSNTETGTQFPGPGFPGSGSPESGFSGPITRRSPDTDHTDSVAASQLRPGEPRKPRRGTGEQPPLDDALPEGAPKIETPERRAWGIARGWIDWRDKRGAPIAGARVDHKLMKLALEFINARYTDDEIKSALANLDEAIPSLPQMQREVERIRNVREQKEQRRFGDRRSQTGPMSGITRHVDDLTDEERDAKNPFIGAVRSSDVMGDVA